MATAKMGSPCQPCCSPPPPPPPPGITIPGCACTSTPATLNVTAGGTGCTGTGTGWSPCDSNVTSTFEPFTLTWGTVPAVLGTAPGGVGMPNAGGNAYVAGPFPFNCVAAGAGDQYWEFYCSGSNYHLVSFLVYPGFAASVYSVSSAFPITGAPACSPFHVQNGTTGCFVQVDG